MGALGRLLKRGSIAMWVSFGGLLAPVQAQVEYVYQIRLGADLHRFDVQLCFDRSVPLQLLNTDMAANEYLLSAAWRRGEMRRPLRERSDQLILPQDSQPGDCVEYSVDVRADLGPARFRSRQRHDGQTLVGMQSGLWLPEPLSEQAEIELEFTHPPAIQVVAPGHLLARSATTTRYRLLPRPVTWPARIAIGSFEHSTLQYGKGRVDIAVLRAQGQVDMAKMMQKIMHWLRVNLTALQSVYNEFPVSNLQILVIPVGQDTEPVPWGQAMRGGGDAIHLYIDETQPLASFLDDWVLIHELSHLLHPRLAPGGNWWSEGLASYYQNILAARGGLKTPEQAWRALDAGFERGRQGTDAKRTLVQAVRDMRRDRLFMRVYWSGAAIALLADYRLRKQTAQRESLDTALAKLRGCCLPANRLWTARELMVKLDELTQTRVFTDLYSEYAFSRQFPQLSAVYAQLGLSKQDDKRLHFEDNAEDAAIRKAIMRPADS